MGNPELVTFCPHCLTEKVGFTFHGEYPVYSAGKVYSWNTFFVCRKCRTGIVAVFQHPRHPDGSPQTGLTPISGREGDPQRHGFHLLTVYPTLKPIEAPYAVPTNIAKNYVEAEENLARKQFNSAGLMFRRVLELLTLDKLPDEAKKQRQDRKNLKQRIALLAEQYKLSDELQDLANHIRLDGNVAAHDDKDFDEASAHQMKDFTSLFLQYIYTLPQLVNDAREKEGPPSTAPAGSQGRP